MIRVPIRSRGKVSPCFGASRRGAFFCLVRRMANAERARDAPGRLSGETPVNLAAIHGPFAACSYLKQRDNREFTPFCYLALVFGRQGPEVRILSPRPFFY
jgi:hypothetical protein